MPEWPNSINYLADTGSFSKKPSSNRLRTDFDDGPARSRKRFSKSTSDVSFTITMSEEEFTSFEGFWADDLSEGNRWFFMPVYLGRSGYERSKVRPTQTYSVSDAGFGRVSVSLNLEIVQASIIDGGTVWFIDQFGEDALGDISDPLNEVVNEMYPEAMETY